MEQTGRYVGFRLKLCVYQQGVDKRLVDDNSAHWPNGCRQGAMHGARLQLGKLLHIYSRGCHITACISQSRSEILVLIKGPLSGGCERNASDPGGSETSTAYIIQVHSRLEITSNCRSYNHL